MNFCLYDKKAFCLTSPMLWRNKIYNLIACIYARNWCLYLQDCFFMKKKLTEFNLKQRNEKIPILRAGDIVKITRKIKEGNKETSQLFEGVIIAIKGKQSSSPMITVRKVSHGVGTELILPLYSPSIGKIILVKRSKTRRSKLYYIREKSTKSLKMKYKDLSEFTKTDPVDIKTTVDEEDTKKKDDEKK